jgi:hypothetical protein
MATLLQVFYDRIHYFLQLHLRFIHFTTVAANLVILAINTSEIASAEKHIADAIFAADNGFFAVMNADGTDIET